MLPVLAQRLPASLRERVPEGEQVRAPQAWGRRRFESLGGHYLEPTQIRNMW